MSLRQVAAALLAALAGGCASLNGPVAASGKPVPADMADPPGASTTVAPQASAAQPATPLGVQVQIEAPPALLTLLQTHLDLVRLGRLARDDVDDSEWSRLIDAAPAQVRELLQTEGFFSPELRLERAPGRAAGRPDRVVLWLEPGPRARVQEVHLEVAGELQRDADAGQPHATATLQMLRRDWDLPVGSDFRNADWNEAKADLLSRLRAAGYATAAWRHTHAAVDVAPQAVRLTLHVDSGPLFRFGSLEIEGLVRHDAATVGHLAATPRGAPVTESMLLDFQERLQKSGLFDSIAVTLDPDPQQAAQARVLARLRESPLQLYTFGLGISANTGARASVEHLYRRVFGAAASSRLRLEAGQRRQALDVELGSHAGPDLWRYLIGGSVERLRSDDDQVLSQRVRLGRGRDAIRHDRLLFVEAERSLLRPDGGQRSNAFGLSLNVHSGWRQLDSIVLPTDGQTLSLQLGVGQSHGTDAERGPFGRAYGRLVLYRPLGRTWYGQARVELGRVFLRQRMVVPESQKWRAGGDDSVRGYGYRSLGPPSDGAVGSGTALFTLSVEAARPVSLELPSLWWAGFVDVGQAANRFSDLSPALGLGVGVRWRSPVGPLRLDWAWGQETRKARLHFSVGIVF